MTRGPLLSFCIPVYNFGAYLPATIESIRLQMTDEVEVVVLDGGSTDETPRLMKQAAAQDSRIRYVRQDQRGGVDADLAICIEAARGRYCWLFSGDDLVRPGAVAYVLAMLELGADVHLLTHNDCTLDMRFLGVHPVLRSRQPFRADLGRDQDRRSWMERALNTEALFSFVSTLVVLHDTWASVPPRRDFDRSGWGHVARFLEIARRRLDIIYHPVPLVDRRGENDSFRDRGIVNRLALAVDGYHRIAAEFARDGTEAEQIRGLVRADLPVTVFIGAKSACRRDPQRESRTRLDALFAKCHGGRGLSSTLKAVLYRSFPALLEPLARHLLRACRHLVRLGARVGLPRREGNSRHAVRVR